MRIWLVEWLFDNNIINYIIHCCRWMWLVLDGWRNVRFDWLILFVYIFTSFFVKFVIEWCRVLPYTSLSVSDLFTYNISYIRMNVFYLWLQDYFWEFVALFVFRWCYKIRSMSIVTHHPIFHLLNWRKTLLINLCG